MKQQKALTLKTLTKSNVWEVEENDIFRMWETAEKESDFRDNRNHYIDVIRSAFEIEEIKIDKPEVIKKYEARDFKVGNIHFDDNENKKWGIKKRAINRITDLTYENIHHISAAKLMEVLDRNFGGGWDSLSQSVQDIIEAGFDISQSGKHTHKQTLLQGCKYRQLFASGCQKNVSGCVRKCLDTAFIIGKHMHGSSALFHAFVFRYATDSIVHSPLEPQIWNSTSFCTLPDVGRHFCGKRMRSIHDCRIVVLSVFFQQGAHFLYVQSSYTDLHTGKFRHDHLTVFGCYMHITGNMCP